MQALPLHLRFDRETYPAAADRVAAWREAMSLAVDVAFTPAEEESFEGSLDFLPLGPVLLTVSRATAHTAIRSKETIARGGDTQVILDVFPRGGFHGMVGSKPLTVNAGDCFLMDLKQTLHVHLEDFHYIGAVIPRGMLGEKAGAKTNIHGLHLAASTVEAKLIGSLLRNLVEQIAHVSPSRAEPLGAGLVSLICGCLFDPGVIVERKYLAPTVVQVLRHIERHADDLDLGPTQICAAFDLSRTALYDLLKPLGGVTKLIRKRRSQRARRLLNVARQQMDSIDAIARASGFKNERAMRRALRDVYDTTPAKIRRVSLDRGVGATEHSVEIAALLDARR